MINELKLKEIIIDYILIIGGFSQNKIFKNEIEDYFYKKNGINIQYLSSYETIISKGSILYGINHDIIKNIKSPITIGIKYNKKIEILIRKGEQINNYIYIIKYIKPFFKNQKMIQINIYVSNEDNLDDELNNKFFGRLLLKLNDSKEELIQLIIKYDTCFHFYSSFYYSKKEIETEFEFFK